MKGSSFEDATLFYQQGRFSEAAGACRAVLAGNSGHAGALHMSGALLLREGPPKQALVPLRKAEALAPDSAEVFLHLGEAGMALGRWAEAASDFRQAVALEPGRAEPHVSLGMALQRQKLPDEALDAFRVATLLAPRSAAAWCNYGAALMEKGLPDEAAAAFRKALETGGEDPDIHTNLGAALAALNRVEEAIQAYQTAIRLNPRGVTANNNLGNLYLSQGFPDKAVDSIKEAIGIDPNLAELHNHLGNALKAGGRIDEALDSYRRAIRKSKLHQTAHDNLLFGMHYAALHDDDAILNAHRQWNRTMAAPLKSSIRPHSNNPDPDRPLRIGYVSPDLRNHPVAWFLLPLLSRHDKREYEIHLYSCGKADGAWSGRLRSHGCHWHDIASLSDDDAAALIRGDGIDILVDLALHSSGNRLLLFARKPAPVQITWLAYPGTSGLDAMDYRLSDPYLDPPESGNGAYTESTIRLPHTYWCYEPALEIPPGAPPVLRNGFVTFGCFNNFCKINEQVLELWAVLLGQVPFSHLHLHASEGSHRGRVLDFMASRDVEPDRIRFFPQVPLAGYFEQFHDIDIALDPFPFGGGTSTFDALWMGVPVITLTSRTAVGRGATSILANLGMEECIAATPARYVEIAAEMAADTARLVRYRSELRTWMRASPVMDALSFARAFEAACREAWAGWCRNC